MNTILPNGAVILGRILCPQTTDAQPILRLYHFDDEWGAAAFSVDDLAADVSADDGDDAELAELASAIGDLVEGGEYMSDDGAYCYRTDQPERVQAQYATWLAAHAAE